MRLFLLSYDLDAPAPVWAVVRWGDKRALHESFDLVPLNHRIFECKPAGRLARWRFLRSERQRLCEEVRRNIDPHQPNVLWINAFGHLELRYAQVLAPVLHLFSHRVLNVNDTYEPRHVHWKDYASFDRIYSICGDQARELERIGGIPSSYFCPPTDTLNYHCASDHRPIDMIVVGRRHNDAHEVLHRHFNRLGSPHIYLDFVTRPRGRGQLLERDFTLLLHAYSKSKIAFCFEPGNISRFRGASPITTRWAHAWTAGCTILGRRPRGIGTAEAMDWPESVLDLPESPDAWIPYVEALLEDEAGMVRRRRRNVLEVMRRHDIRYRLRDMCHDLGLPLPPGLELGLQALATKIDELQSAWGEEAGAAIVAHHSAGVLHDGPPDV